jgi:hypothetical protein
MSCGCVRLDDCIVAHGNKPREKAKETRCRHTETSA